jgi:AcrR family transcriptional regulator
MTTSINETDPRVKRTRQLLYQALFALWQEKGFRAITVQDITERATINRATFYAHFADKFALLDSSIRERFQQVLTQSLPDTSVWSRDHLRQLIRAVFGFMAEPQHECSPADKEIDALFQVAIQQEIAHVLSRWFASSAFVNGPAGVSEETLSTLWSWAIFGVATHWSAGTRLVSMDQMVTQIMETLTPSLREC